MSELVKSVKCKVNGVVSTGLYQGRRVSAMCGKIRCSSNDCSLQIGECEHQYIEAEKKGLHKNDN